MKAGSGPWATGRRLTAPSSCWETTKSSSNCYQNSNKIRVRRKGAKTGQIKGRIAMPKYVIERVVPGASKMTPLELKSMSQRSCNVLNELGPQIQWVHSYVTDNKIYCVYIAPNEELVHEHARLGGFPENHVAQVKTVIDPTTSEE